MGYLFLVSSPGLLNLYFEQSQSLPKFELKVDCSAQEFKAYIEKRRTHIRKVNMPCVSISGLHLNAAFSVHEHGFCV